MRWLRHFHEHPQSVGETYWQHMRSALFFGSTMFIASLACLIHAVLPFAFKTRGSEAVRLLHSRMVLNRRRSDQARQEQFQP